MHDAPNLASIERSPMSFIDTRATGREKCPSQESERKHGPKGQNGLQLSLE